MRDPKWAKSPMPPSGKYQAIPSVVRDMKRIITHVWNLVIIGHLVLINPTSL